MTPTCLSRAEGSPHQFTTTHWSVVMLAGKIQSSESNEALEKLCRAYWLPLYAFIRRRGHHEADAQDLTQEFFTRLLRRHDFHSVDRSKGRFRTFLLAALTHFLANEWDHSQAAKRGGGREIISLDEIKAEQWRDLEPRDDLSADKVFDQRWAMTLLHQALLRLRAEMADEGKSSQFELLKAYLTCDPAAGDYASVAAQLEKTSQSVAVAVHRLRARYQSLVRAEVAQTVASPLDVDAEMRHLLAALS